MAIQQELSSKWLKFSAGDGAPSHAAKNWDQIIRLTWYQQCKWKSCHLRNPVAPSLIMIQAQLNEWWWIEVRCIWRPRHIADKSHVRILSDLHVHTQTNHTLHTYLMSKFQPNPSRNDRDPIWSPPRYAHLKFWIRRSFPEVAKKFFLSEVDEK